MLRTMSQSAAAFAASPSSGAKVGPSVVIRSPSIPVGPMTPSHTTGTATK